MAINNFYREVWKDEELRKNKVTQRDVAMITEAVGRTIQRLLKENSVFKWRDNFTLRVTNIKGWETKSVHTKKDHTVEDFKRVYIKPSKKFKNYLKE